VATDRSGLDRGFVQEHDGNIVLDRIDPLALGALERGPVLDEVHFRLAVGTREDLEQFRIDGHASRLGFEHHDEGARRALISHVALPADTSCGRAAHGTGRAAHYNRSRLRRAGAGLIIVREMRVFTLVLAAVVLSAPPLAAQQPAASAPPDGNAAYYFLLGRHLESENKIDEAIEAHKKAIELQPSSAELRAELAGLYARQDRAVDAIDMAEEALKKDPDNQEANRILGSIYAALSEQKQPIRPGDKPSEYAARGISALEKARRDGTFDVVLEFTLGRLYAQTGAFDKAIPILRKVVDDQPGYTEGAFLLAASQEGAGNLDDAVETLERTVRESPTFLRGQLKLGELYERQQAWSKAAAAFARVQEMNPRTTALSGRRAAALINAGKPGEARDLLQSMLAAKPDSADPAVLYLLAEAQRAMKDLPAAEATAQKLLEANPADVRGLHVLSLIQQDKGDAKAAERTLRDIVARDPLDANALNSLGYMLADRRERLDEAVELLQRALKIEPSNPSYLDSLGWAYFQQGRLELADAPLTEAAAKLTDSSVVQEHLGDLRFKQQRYDDAASAWEKALAGDGRDIDRNKIQQKIRDARSRLEQR
jgi:tetratricopeptide (TPR) repeat protein